MTNRINRRQFFAGALCSAVATASPMLSKRVLAETLINRKQEAAVKFGLNAYSFNEPLRAGEMTLDDVIDYCARLELAGLDATAYYFPGYPQVPEDSYLYNLKKRAFLNGVTINGTGVKNDFAVLDADLRKKDVQMVKNWIEAAEKLGATVIRIFSGAKVPEGYTFDQVLECMVPDIQECVEHGVNHGVIVGLQNHNDFAKTAAETIRIVDAVNSGWFGVILDTGSLRQLDPYEEIARLLPYAVSWQLKESVWYGEKEMPVDLNKINEIINRGGYRGFLPIETLGSGDPKVKIENLLAQMRAHIKSA
jgi:sugar phosphate isomerase/epimerase